MAAKPGPRPPTKSAAARCREAELGVADQIGRLMDFWGFKRVHGRVWTILFLAEQPLSAADIRHRLDISVGATSMALAELRRWGAVREVHSGSRSVHFEPETNIWRLVSRVLQDRERRMLDETLELFEDALAVLRTGIDGVPCSSARRVERLVWLTRLARGMLDMLSSRGELAAQDTRKMRV
jgi:DNA-binding transcriptional regulator GbsR (MarR family)